MSGANGTLGADPETFPSLKATNNAALLLPFRERIYFDADLGFHSLHSLHPRLYKSVAFGDKEFVGMNIELVRLLDLLRRSFNARRLCRPDIVPSLPHDTKKPTD
jgi:hypothetical protein